MNEYIHFSREGLPPRTPEQNEIKKIIEHQIETITVLLSILFALIIR